MASNRAPASVGENADWAEHERTYQMFLWLLKVGAALTAVVLLALYFLLAR